MLSRIIKSSLYSIGSRMFSTSTNLIIMFLISRKFSPGHLGIFGISTFFYYFFAYISSMELTLYFGREMAIGSSIHKEKTLSEVFKIFYIGIIVSIPLFFIIFLTYGKLPLEILLITVISGILFGLEKNLHGVLLGIEKLNIEVFIQFITMVMVLGPLLLWGAKIGIFGIYLLKIFASLIGIPIRISGISKYIIFNKTYLRDFFNIRWNQIKDFALLGLSLFIHYHLDLLLLSFLISHKIEGAYFLSLKIFVNFAVFSEIITFSLTPFIRKIYKSKKLLLFNQIGLPLFILSGLLFSLILFLIKDIIVDIFFASEIAELSKDYLSIFSFVLFFRFVSFYTGGILISTKFQNIKLYIHISTAILILVLEVLLGNFYLVYGIIAARAITELVLFFLLLFYSRKVVIKNIIS